MKFKGLGLPSGRVGSHPARGAWIEILKRTLKSVLQLVAPRKGCVD